MRAIFGLVGILVVMAIVAILMKQNLQATRSTGGAGAPATLEGVKVPQVDTSKNVREQSQQIQQQVQTELNQALQQGANRVKDTE